MQPYDALTLKAVLEEAKPALLNSKVDKVHQMGRDEIIISLRQRSTLNHLRLSANSVFGRISLTSPVQSSKATVSSFVQLLRKALTGATLIGIEQILGERIADFIFSCSDEVGSLTIKILTAEIMGKHSNLIFWEKETAKILAASHCVTTEMSRQRQIVPQLRYVRPPQQDKPNIFQVSQKQFMQAFAEFADSNKVSPEALCNWLAETYSGWGRHLIQQLAETIIITADKNTLAAAVWQHISNMQNLSQYAPCINTQTSTYNIFGNLSFEASSNKRYDSANKMVDDYFGNLEAEQQFKQKKQTRISAIKTEITRIKSRLDTAKRQLLKSQEMEKYKEFGDLILAHLTQIAPRQAAFSCTNFDGEQVNIPLKPDLTGAQNSQHYYRQFSKAKAKREGAQAAYDDSINRLQALEDELAKISQTTSLSDLEQAKVKDRRPQAVSTMPGSKQKKSKPSLFNWTSQQGWSIYLGRNRTQNDQLLSQIGRPYDVWLHVLGHSGAHVIIKTPSTKQDPPLATLQEAAQAAAYFSKAAGKVRVVYTQCRFVKKIGKALGLVSYENEKTLEIDASAALPQSLQAALIGKK